jgi:hypothetical protein
VSLADVILRFATTVPVTRTAVSFVNGRAQQGAPDEFEIEAAVQPATPKELARLPEGQRSREVIAVYTETELRIGGPGAAADRIGHAGATYEVHSVERWDVGGFYKALAARL